MKSRWGWSTLQTHSQSGIVAHNCNPELGRPRLDACEFETISGYTEREHISKQQQTETHSQRIAFSWPAHPAIPNEWLIKSVFNLTWSLAKANIISPRTIAKTVAGGTLKHLGQYITVEANNPLTTNLKRASREKRRKPLPAKWQSTFSTYRSFPKHGPSLLEL